MSDYTDVDLNPRAQKGLRQVTEQVAWKTLEMLDENSRTGPDLLPAKILKTGAEEFATPVMTLAALILISSEWPESWRGNIGWCRFSNVQHFSNQVITWGSA